MAKTPVVTLRIPARVLVEINKAAELEGTNRAAWLLSAAMERLNGVEELTLEDDGTAEKLALFELRIQGMEKRLTDYEQRLRRVTGDNAGQPTVQIERE